MKLWQILGLTTIGVVAVSTVIEHSQTPPNPITRQPITTASIIIPTFNEESFIVQSLESLKGQSIIQEYPEYFELILVDSGSNDRTVEFAKPYVDQIIMAPRGKLTARRMGIEQATGKIIVSVDADSIYPQYWLNTLLEPFHDSEVIAVNGSTIDNSIPGVPLILRNVGEAYEKLFHPNQLLGRNSAFYKDAYYLTGGFNESIKQTNVWYMVNEEEIRFGNNMAKLGKVIIKMNAPCIHLGGQKIGCRISNYASCAKYGIGVDRF